MSILVKGIEMPKMPTTYSQGEVVPYIDVRIFADGKAVTPECRKPYFTEYSVIEVPTPHGHLIDSAELLSAKFAGIYHDPIVSDGVEKSDKEVYAYRVGWNTALDAAYLNAPIVVSAEGE